MIVFGPPLDFEGAPGKTYIYRPARPARSRRGDGRSASCRPAGACKSSPALPNAKLDAGVRALAGHGLGERDIRALWKERMALQLRSEYWKIVASGIRNPEYAVWISDIDRARIFQDAPIWEAVGQR